MAARLRISLAHLHERIDLAQSRYGRSPGSVALLAVTKAFGPEVIAAAAALGQRAFGENYAQEAVDKMDRLAALMPAPGPGGVGVADLEWHFIGPIQSNKTRLIASRFAWVQSIERLSIAQRLSAQRPPGMAPLQVLIEVNVSGEASKSGVAPDQVAALAEAVAALPNLCLRGLMAIPAPGLPPAEQHAAFARMRALFEQLRARFPGIDTLSMGMTADFEVAIAEGATMVRVGSAIFGERP
jgi:pyridoxal phosphate enzyme (YggS family)